jgi:acyl carrier protein
MEIALQAAADQGALHKGEDICLFDKISFEHPYVLTEQIQHADGIETQLDTSLFNNNWEFTCTSETKRVYCSGQIRSHHTSSQVITDLLCRKMVQAERLKRSFTALSGRFTQTFNTRTIYNMIFPRVVEYKEPYLTLRHLSISDSGLEGHGTFVLEPLKSESGGRFLTTPAFLDTLLHTAGFIANTYVSPDIACICASLEHAMVSIDMSEIHGKDLQVYCCIGDIGKAFIADAYALDPQGKLIAYVEGMCFKKINLQSFKTILARSTTTVPNGKPTTPATVPKSTLRAKNVSMPKSLIQSNPSKEIQLRSAILSTICDVCGFDRDPPSSKSLEELGIDSLLVIELIDTLRKEFSRTDFSKVHVEDCKTIEDLITAIIEASETGVTSTEATPMRYTKLSPAASSREERVVSLIDGQDDLAIIVKSVFMDICGLDPTAEMGRRLCFLGVDSLMTIELVDALHSRLNINIDHAHGDISELTYQQLENLCKAQVTFDKPPSSVSESSDGMGTPSSTPEEQSSMIEEPIANMEDKANCPSTLLYHGPTESASLYMFHDGSGMSKMYGRLDNMNRDVYGISSLSFPSFVPRNTDAQTMEELASYYIKSTDLGAKSDIILGGKSIVRAIY